MKIDQILQDYSHTRVPVEARKSLSHLLVIIFAAVTTVLGFMLSQSIFSTVVGGSAAGVVCPSDITRFTKSGKDGVYSYGFCCILAFVLILLFAIMLKGVNQTSYESLIAFLNIGVIGIIFLFTAT